MKKTLIAVLALAAVAACNKAEVIEQSPSNAIGFDNVFVDNTTKSVDDQSYNADNMFEDFAVYGFVEGATLFDGTRVSKNITNGDLTSDWKYDGTQYWIAGAKYNFCAVAPMTNGGWTKTACAVVENAEIAEIATSLTFTNNGTTDLLYAEAPQVEGRLTGNATVGFTFRHILSKVKFSFENAYNASNATIAVSDIKITDAFNTAAVALNDESANWTTHDGNLVLQFGAAVNETADDDENNEGIQISNEPDAFAYGTTLESYNELFMIPGALRIYENKIENGQLTTIQGYTVTFKVDLFVGGTLIKTYNHTATVNFKPEPGNSYDLKATINPENIDPENKQEPIQFTVTEIKDWEKKDINF